MSPTTLASWIATTLVLFTANLSALDYPTLLERAEQAYRARDTDSVIGLFEEIVERDPLRGDAWFGLSRGYEWAERLDEAIIAAERAQEIGWEYAAWPSYRVAQLHARAGHREAALTWLDRALSERFEDRPEIAGDEAFASLRENDRFRRLAGIPPEALDSRDELWRFDLAYLVEEAQRMHADPGRPAFSEEFRRAADALGAEIDSLADDEIYLRMMQLLAVLDDGHTAIYSPDSDSPCSFESRRLPFKFYLFPKGLFIVDAIGDWTSYAGSRVVRFGDVPAQEVLRRMSRYRGVDNPMTWKWMGPQFYVGRLVMLRGVGVMESGDVVDLTLEAADGTISDVRVEGGDYDIVRKLRPSPATDVDPPLWLSNVDENYWLRALPDHRAVYFQFNQVRNGEDETIADVAQRLRKALIDEDVTRLIVDVRHNNGGNNSLVRPLVRTMVEFEMRDDDHRIVILTGRNTFSAAQNFINRVEQWTDARFAGEPSSSSPNFVGEETNLLLPYSRIRGSISTRLWQDSMPGDDRPWIPVDLPVELTAADYFRGRDPVLEAVLATFE